MKSRLGMHPKEYALGETERYYSRMSQKGWELVRRGVVFSRFRKAEPKPMGYRVEVAAPKLLINGRLPEELAGAYTHRGWEYVTGSGYIHVFRSPAESHAPEVYLKPEQQAATLKCLRKKQLLSLMRSLGEIILFLLLSFSLWNITAGHWAAQLYGVWIEHTGLVLACGLLLLWIMGGPLWGMWHLHRLYGKMKRGVPLDHAPRTRIVPAKVVDGIVLAVILVCLVGDIASYTSSPMPVSTQEPYVLLSDLGVQGERIPNPIEGKASVVEYHRSILAQCWHGWELICEENQQEKWLTQEVYLLEDARMVHRLAEALMVNSTFAQDGFTPVEIPGLDGAYAAGDMECIAIKGNRVGIFTHRWSSREEMVESLEKISEKWN